jgi:hypothetical protein
VSDKPLTEDEIAVLLSMDGIQYWQRPMDVGGHDGSHHSRTLAKLVARGFAEVQQRSAYHGRRGSKEYRLTVDGQAAVNGVKRWSE